jgi:Tol biopolymer transport system component
MVTRQVTLDGTSSRPSLSPDAKWGAYWTGDSLMTVELASGQAVLAARGRPSFDNPKWSRDGSTILYGAEDSQGTWLYTVPRLGGATTRIAEIGFASFDYSPDAREVISSPAMQDSIYVTDVLTGQVVHRWSVAPTSFTAWRTPVSPDGRWIAFGGEREGIPWLGVVSSDGSTIRRLVDWVDRGTLQWSPRGDAIYFFQRVPGGANLMKVHLDQRTGERLGERTLVWSHAPFGEFAVGADGRTLLYAKASPTSRVWAMEIDNRSGATSVRSRQLTSGTARYGNPVISPDGKWVAYGEDEGTQRNICVIPFEGGPARLVGPTRADALMPRWSPDGRQLAFASADSSTGGIMIADVIGGRPQHHGTSRLCLYYATFAWSPDGKTVMYPSDDPRKFVILDVETDKEAILVPPKPIGWLRGPAFSPDGRELVIASIDHNLRATHWRVELESGVWTRIESADGAGYPILWSREGWIYTASSQEIRRVRPQGKESARYARLPKACFLWTSLPSIDDSARRLVCTVVEYKPDIWVATDFDPEVRQ